MDSSTIRREITRNEKMTANNLNSSIKVRKTTLTRLKAIKNQGEPYDHFFNRILDDRNFEQKNYSDIEKATHMANETLESCKKELDDLFDSS